MVTPLVSVIVPVYNRGLVLHETMDCICNQSYKNIEIIVVDDGSSDDSLEILRSYQQKDARVQVIEQQHRFAGAARNLGMQFASGQYYLFLDSDDLFELDMIEALLNRALETGCEVVMCKSDLFNQAGEFFPMPHQIQETFIKNVDQFNFNVERDCPESGILFYIGWAWDKLFSADYIRKSGLNWPEMRFAEDGPFVFPALALAPSCSIIDRVLVHYRVADTHEQASSGSNADKHPTMGLESASLIYERLTKRNASATLLNSCRLWMVIYIEWMFGIMQGSSAVQLLKQIACGFDEKYQLEETMQKLCKEDRWRDIFSVFSIQIANYLNLMKVGRFLSSRYLILRKVAESIIKSKDEQRIIKWGKILSFVRCI